jgi:hypothetical protein
MTTEFPSYERVMTAEALLLLADALGIKVGSDGVDVVTVSTSRVPRHWFDARSPEERAAILQHLEQRKERRGK